MNKIRAHGLILIVFGLLATAAIIALGNKLYGQGNWGFYGYGFAIPGALGLAGALQLISGVPFGEISNKWNELAGWQRGFLGVIFIIVASAIIIAILLTVATLQMM